MRRLVREVGRRVNASEGLEVVDEMRLIEVATTQRNVCPINLRRRVDETQDLLKTAHAAEQLRRQTDLFAKDLDEAPRAQARLIRHVRDRTRVSLALQFSERVGDGAMA